MRKRITRDLPASMLGCEKQAIRVLIGDKVVNNGGDAIGKNM